jgi:hypothetical protein
MPGRKKTGIGCTDIIPVTQVTTLLRLWYPDQDRKSSAAIVSVRDSCDRKNSFFGNIGSVETDMNLWGSLPDHENRNVYDGTPPRASPRHGGQVFFELFVTDPPRGRPFGGGGNHRKCECLKKSRIIDE